MRPGRPSTHYFFFFAAFLAFFFAGAFFLAFFLAAIGMRDNSSNVSFGSGGSFRPQNVSNMGGLHFQMQYRRAFAKIAISRDCHLSLIPSVSD